MYTGLNDLIDPKTSPKNYSYSISKIYSLSITNNYFYILDYQKTTTKNKVEEKSSIFRGEGCVFWLLPKIYR